MPLPASAALHNRLLSSLKADDLALLLPALRRVELPVMTVLEEAREPVKNVYFFESGLASVVTGDKVPIEIGLIGREGMTGLSILLHDDRSVNRTFMQASGTALSMSADRLRTALLDIPILQASLLRYVHAATVQTSQTALANGRAKLDARLARWLLMAHDRFDRNDFPFTHQFLAMMLGVRRAGVTDTLHILEGRGLIKPGRGLITVLDRKGLEAVADPSYGVPEAEYARLVLNKRSDRPSALAEPLAATAGAG
jgi:CRP-like cAMP-binding protein